MISAITNEKENKNACEQQITVNFRKMSKVSSATENSISSKHFDAMWRQLSSVLSDNGTLGSMGDSPSFNVGILMYIATINQEHWLRPTLYASKCSTEADDTREMKIEKVRQINECRWGPKHWGLDCHCEMLHKLFIC